MSLDVIAFPEGPMDNFLYLVANRREGLAAVIDPAWDAEQFTLRADAEGLTICAIWLTHSHEDHVNAISALQARLPAQVPVFISTAEAEFWPDCPKDAQLFDDNAELQLGQARARALLTPGHSPGSCVFHLGDDLIAGDTLFSYGCGHCLMPGSDPVALYHSLRRLDTQIEDSVRIWPGHDYSVAPSLTMREQRQGNPFLHCENVDDFVRYRMDIHKNTRQTPFAAIDKESLKKLL